MHGKKFKAEMLEDEMDKLNELKSSRIGIVFAGGGFIAGHIVLALDQSPALMLNILFLSFCVGSLLDEATKLLFYRKGVHYG